MDRSKAKINVYVIACMLSVTTGFSFLGAKVALAYATPLEALFYRFLFAFLFAVIICATGIVKVKFKGKSLKKLLAPTAMYVIGFFGFQFFGLLYATSIEAGIIFAVIPVFTMIIAELFLKERPNVIQRICVTITILSIVVMFLYNNGGIGPINPLGFVLLLLSSLCMATNNVLIRWIRDEFTPAEIGVAASTLGFGLYTTITLILGAINDTLAHTIGLITNVSFVIAVVYLGIGCIMLTTLMNAYTMANLEAVRASAFGNISTVIALCAGTLILHEPLTGVHIVCVTVIIFGVLGTNYFRRKVPERLAQDEMSVKSGEEVRDEK